MTNQFIFLIVVTLLSSCSGIVTNQKPVGQSFPKVTGTALNDQSWTIPDQLKGEYSVLLIGYVQDSQFDIDRWLLAFEQVQSTVNLFEIPTIRGLFPRVFSNQIDDGMRSGIPQNLWKAVITVYKEADTIVNFLGNEKPRNARVVVLGPNGQIKFFHDQGFSTAAFRSLLKEIPQEKYQFCLSPNQ